MVFTKSGNISRQQGLERDGGRVCVLVYESVWQREEEKKKDEEGEEEMKRWRNRLRKGWREW